MNEVDNQNLSNQVRKKLLFSLGFNYVRASDSILENGNAVLTFQFVHQILSFDHSSLTLQRILSHGIFYLVCTCNFCIYEQNPMVQLAIQMEPVQQYFHMVLFVQYVVLTFESVYEILWCYHSNETSSAVLSHGTIYLVCSSIFESVDEILWCYNSNETSSAVLSLDKVLSVLKQTSCILLNHIYTIVLISPSDIPAPAVCRMVVT